MDRSKASFFTFSMLLLLLISFAGCKTAILSVSKPPSSPVIRTVARLSMLYLNAVIRNDSEAVLSMHAMGQKSSLFKLIPIQLKQASRAWPMESSPFIGYVVQDVTQSDDVARVLLKNPYSQSHPVIHIEFVWVGRGWMIQDDNVFGQDGLLTRALPEQQF